MSAVATCPGCGAPVSFRFQSSIVNVCSHCRTVVARTDRAFEDLGKIADLVATESPLAVGLQGSVREVPFELTGRLQLRHPAGGVWDEWYANFADGRVGWLAEAQGKFYLTFETPLPSAPPPFADLRPGAQVLGQGFVVAEKGVAEALGAAGEIPYRLEPASRYAYADLSGSNGAFATLDYGGGTTTLYVGHELSLRDLGFSPAALRQQTEAPKVKAAKLTCPHCGGPFELRAPDATERVTCPYCRALSDVRQGNLIFLKVLDPPFVPDLPLGTQGTLEPGPLFTIIGFAIRSVVFNSIQYPWSEYLLYAPEKGFRWLVESDGHWSYVESVPVGSVVALGKKAHYRGHSFRMFQTAYATYDHIEGEFYWRVEAGEGVTATDYVKPPFMLSCEESNAEVNWSLATYKTRDEVSKAFGVKIERHAVGVAPNQPFPHSKIYRYGLFLFTTVFFLFLAHAVFGSPSRQVVYESFPVKPDKALEGSQVLFFGPFELRGKNVEIEVSVPVNNSWAFVQGDLVDDDTGLVQAFDIPIEYYSGSDSDGAWTEGAREGSVVVSAVPAGHYTLRLEVQRERAVPGETAQVGVREGVSRVGRFVFVLLLLSFGPILAGILHYRFAMKRWEDSDFSPFNKAGSS